MKGQRKGGKKRKIKLNEERVKQIIIIIIIIVLFPSVSFSYDQFKREERREDPENEEREIV